MTVPQHPVLATVADVPDIERLISAAYSKYVARIGKPPSPMLADYPALVAGSAVWMSAEMIAWRAS